MDIRHAGMIAILQLILISIASAQAVQWFRDAKFGIFVHWGLYSQPAGECKGKRYYGSGEWLLVVFTRPAGNEVLVPGFSPLATGVVALSGNKSLTWTQNGKDVYIQLPAQNGEDAADEVFVMTYAGRATPPYDSILPVTVSPLYAANGLPVIRAKSHGNLSAGNFTYAHYYGDWKHVACISGMSLPADSAGFDIRFTKPGYYEVSLEYTSPAENSRRKGVMRFKGQDYFFNILGTRVSSIMQEYSNSLPMMFIRHPLGMLKVPGPGEYEMTWHPVEPGEALFKLKSVLADPVY